MATYCQLAKFSQNNSSKHKSSNLELAFGKGVTNSYMFYMQTNFSYYPPVVST